MIKKIKEVDDIHDFHKQQSIVNLLIGELSLLETNMNMHPEQCWRLYS